MGFKRIFKRTRGVLNAIVNVRLTHFKRIKRAFNAFMLNHVNAIEFTKRISVNAIEFTKRIALNMDLTNA